MRIERNLSCCGIHELVDIGIEGDNNPPEEIIEEVCKSYFRNESKCAFYIFSDIHRKRRGKQLVEYITKNELGKITESPTKINPNSESSLKVWIWTINTKNLRIMWSKILIKKPQLKEY